MTFFPNLLHTHQKMKLLGVGAIAAIVTTGYFSNQLSPVPFSTGKTLAQSQMFKGLLGLPLSFEMNMGQSAKPVSYLSRGNGYSLYFTPQEMVFDFRTGDVKNNPYGKFKNLPIVKSNDVLRIGFIGANSNPQIVGEEKLSKKSNYFLGNNPKNWHTDVVNYQKVNYKNLYPGIDMLFYGNQNRLEYDIRVAPGADPSLPKFQMTGIKSMRVDAKGDLLLTTPENKTINMHRPIIYQMIDGKKQMVSGTFKMAANHAVGFDVKHYDKTKPLIIDPIMTMSTYIGGSGGDNAILGMAIGPDATEPQIFVTGYTNSIDFPTTGAYQANNKGNGRTAFIMKYDRSSNTVLYSTYLGGSGGNDEGFAIAVDSVSAAYITGETNSKDFPLQNPFQSTNKNARDFSAFVTKLSPEGNGLVYSTYLGGSGENQEGNGIAVDSLGFAYVTGETTSKDFPVKKAFQATNNGPKFTAYITKFNTLGNDVIFSTYLGGTGGQDEGNGIQVDSDGNIYVTGETNSKDFPTLTPIQAKPVPKGAGQTGFVTKMSASGQGLEWSTYLGGGGGNDYPNAIDIDDLRDVYVAGYTNSSDFPVVNAFQTTNNGPNFTGFVTKINAPGSAIVYSTYWGGSGGNDRINAISVDTARLPHICGQTNSHDFPTQNAIQLINKGPGTTAIGGSLRATGALNNSSYVGGSGGNDICYGIVMDQISDVYLAGLTNSDDFPLVLPLQPTKSSAIMAFLLNISL